MIVLAGVPAALLIGAVGALGLIVGSFLNVAIHRLPLEGETVGHPRRSRCPQCRATLTWRENIPVLSWILQRGRCRSCRWRIPIRYPLVELLTAVLFCLVLWRVPERAVGLLLVQCLVVAGLIVATFVDFDWFEIPDEVSIGGIVLAPVLSLLVPALHDHTWIAQLLTRDWVAGAPVDRAGALAGCLVGMAVGGGILLAIGWVGKRVYGREAMGLGDVKLLAAGGGFVGAGGALAALLLGSIFASIAGVVNIARFYWLSRSRARARGERGSAAKSLRVARIAGRYIPFGPYLGIGIGIALVAWNDLTSLVG